MKTIHAIRKNALLALLVLTAAHGQAQSTQPLAGSKLAIGTAGNTVSDDNAAMGDANSISGTGSFGIGNANTISGTYVLAVGSFNSLTDSAETAAIGVGCTQTNSSWCLLVGECNEIENASCDSLVSGGENLLHQSTGVLMSGIDNVVQNSGACTVLGQGLICDGESAHVVVGGYNEQASSSKPESFTVANGTDEQRKNALVVYQNGDVVIPKAQGDISMGDFAAP